MIDIIEKVKCMKGQWAGHVARMKNTRWAKITSEWTPRDGKRLRGRPPLSLSLFTLCCRANNIFDSNLKSDVNYKTSFYKINKRTDGVKSISYSGAEGL